MTPNPSEKSMKSVKNHLVPSRAGWLRGWDGLRCVGIKIENHGLHGLHGPSGALSWAMERVVFRGTSVRAPREAVQPPRCGRTASGFLPAMASHSADLSRSTGETCTRTGPLSLAGSVVRAVDVPVRQASGALADTAWTHLSTYLPEVQRVAIQDLTPVAIAPPC